MAIKKTGISASIMGDEFKRFLKAMEAEERGSLALGETGGPLLDLYETADDIIVEADLPGIDIGDVDVGILNGILTIEGVKRERVDETEKINYLCMERSFENFKRMVKINVPFNPKGAKACYQRGVLTVVFPKVAEKRGELIKIEVEKK
ncbi:MAG: Hsp20/alpha crystallin family protein [Nitrospirae bacterium]|nr:Hsp20/alpha crystallin family protein [Nitrospirota bacterium]